MLCVLPPLCHALQVVPYEPVPCKSCGAILNPYASVDYYAKIWVCPMCFARCHFPPHYQGISEQNVPAELYPQVGLLSEDWVVGLFVWI
jgi:protein transport protein SEC23